MFRSGYIVEVSPVVAAMGLFAITIIHHHILSYILSMDSIRACISKCVYTVCVTPCPLCPTIFLIILSSTPAVAKREMQVCRQSCGRCWICICSKKGFQ